MSNPVDFNALASALFDVIPVPDGFLKNSIVFKKNLLRDLKLLDINLDEVIANSSLEEVSLAVLKDEGWFTYEPESRTALASPLRMFFAR